MEFSNFVRRVLLTFISLKLLLMMCWIEHIKLSDGDNNATGSFNLVFGSVMKKDGVSAIGIIPCNDFSTDDATKSKCHTVKSSYYIAYACSVCLVMLTALYTDYQEGMTRWKTASLVLPVVAGIFIVIMFGISAHYIDHDGGGDLAFDGFVYALYMVVLCGAYVAALLRAPSGGETSLKEAFL